MCLMCLFTMQILTPLRPIVAGTWRATYTYGGCICKSRGQARTRLNEPRIGYVPGKIRQCEKKKKTGTKRAGNEK
ncbi:hypothetical protein F5Y10DRAFT_242226 [Nemania abortiva]|nr:hypothetical protein F5Y10DRAFT_242226 [Nemania abortiva]